MMMVWGAQKGDAGSEVSLQSCDQTQSRRKTNITDSFFKFNEDVMHLNTKGLADSATVANFATVRAFPMVLESERTTITQVVPNFQTTQQVCENFEKKTKLDDFLRFTERDILKNAGKISHQMALDHANTEFDKFRAENIAAPSPVEKDFEKSLMKLEQIASSAKGKKKGGRDE